MTACDPNTLASQDRVECFSNLDPKQVTFSSYLLSSLLGTCSADRAQDFERFFPKAK